jgi:hypothetical protein
MNNIASWIWVLIPLAAIGIAPFKMWIRVKEKQIEAQTSLAAKKALNTTSTWSASKRVYGCSSRSPPTAAHKQRNRLRRFAITPASPLEK